MIGGPGASSLIGLFSGNGPFGISPSQELFPKNYSWQSNHNMLYIDNPVGTGFSFTESVNGYAKNQFDVGQDLLSALYQFFLLFPDLQANEFFITGESYAGKYVPAIGYAIHQDSYRDYVDDTKPKINLKGLAIGNGLVDPIHQLNYGDFLYHLGLIDFNGRDMFVDYQNEIIFYIKNGEFMRAFEIFDKMINGDKFKGGTLFKNLTGFDFYFNFLDSIDADETPLSKFLEKSETMQAIHVGSHKFHDMIENEVEKHLLLDFLDSVAGWLAELLTHYPILIYCGQMDIMMSYPSTVEYLKKLNFSGMAEYKTAKRHIWRVENEIAGYVKYAGKLTEVLVRNAGLVIIPLVFDFGFIFLNNLNVFSLTQ